MVGEQQLLTGCQLFIYLHGGFDSNMGYGGGSISLWAGRVATFRLADVAGAVPA